MAEVALGAFLQALFENIFKKIGSLIGMQGLTEDLEKLKSTVSKFQHELQAAEMKNFKTQETRDWYFRLKCVANEADGVLDEALKSLNLYADENQVRRLFSSFSRFKIDENRRNNLEMRIIQVTREFNILEVEKSILDREQFHRRRETVSVLSEEISGREEEKNKIINILLNQANTETRSHPFIDAIVGLGGIGKTTLAQLIYNDEKVVEEFDTRIWVWVSPKFDFKLVIEKIIETFSENNLKFESLEATRSYLNKLLKGKKFLLVLDDIWNENQDEWNILKSSLKSGAIGSSVLLTTRESNVASIAGVRDPHKIEVLSEDQCWQVFKESAFLEGNQEIRELEVIGKQIAKKCEGLPLAAKSLGGSLRLKREVREWEYVRDGHIWESGDILPALKLSLNSLESHSWNCFTFCCVFPKGYKMSKEEVIQLWMANDLIPSRERLKLEDVANNIFNDLVLKSFFQVLLKDYDVKMHNLMHDLCLYLRKDCFPLQGPDVPDKIPRKCLHLSIISYHSSRSDILETLSKSHSSLRTCIIKSNGEEITFKNLDCLQALDLSNAKVENLPISIGKIIDLKYLNLSWSGNDYLTHLPDSIGTLTKLQTLKLRGCRWLTQLPNGFTRLVNLRHLDLRKCGSLTHLPDGMGRLMNLRHLDLCGCDKLSLLPDGITQLINLEHLDISSSNVTQLPNEMGQLVNLRTLGGMFSVGRESGQRIAELQGLNQLRGSLEIRGLEHVRYAREAAAANLKNKNNLSSLSLIWGDLEESGESGDKVEDVLEALQPPQNLNDKLVIEGYGGSVFANWMKLVENLVEIELKDCIKCDCLPPLGRLPFLKRLTIKGMESLKCIGTEFYGSNDSGSNNSSSERCAIFPSLKILEFDNMPILEKWQHNQQADSCPRLELLKLTGCPMLTSLPSLILSSLVGLEIRGCDKVIVRSLSCLTYLYLDGLGTSRVTSLPEGYLQNLDALESLWIEGYKELELSSTDFQHLTKLQTIKLAYVPKLTSLPELQRLQSLLKLEIRRAII